MNSRFKSQDEIDNILIMKSYRVTEYYKDLAQKYPVLKKQFIPDSREDVILDYETTDPLDENRYMVSPGLIHRYKNRVLLLVTETCMLYCRHCFRREFIDNGSNISYDDIDLAAKYIGSHPEVQEILLSGGDPLTLSLKKLDYIFKRVKSANPNIIIRIGTRVPIVDPDFLKSQFFDLISKYTAIFFSLQINHPAEISEKVSQVLGKLINSGAVLLNQSVLLKGINDDVNTLANLSNKLMINRVKPYYLFQGDLASGTSHLRVPIKEGLRIVKELRDLVSGIGMPTYAVDIPNGGGKIPLNHDFIDSEDDNYYYLKNSSGFVGKYPKE